MIKFWLLCLCNWKHIACHSRWIYKLIIYLCWKNIGRCFLLVLFNSLWMNLLYKTCVQVLLSTDCTVYAMPSNANCNIEHLCVTVLIIVVKVFQWFPNKSFFCGLFFQHVYTTSECKSLITRNSSQGYWGG